MISMLDRLTVVKKLWMIIGAALIGLAIIVVLAATSIRDSLIQEKQNKTKNLVQSAYGVLSYYQALTREGKMSEEDAKLAAISLLRSMRYDDKEYFWINDMQPRMVMHPFKPELEGKDLSDIKDPKGKHLFVEFVDTVKRDKAGFVNYLWPKPDSKEPVEKISYVMGFEPWGWVIGTGIYIDDVDALFRAKLLRLSIPALAVVTAILLLSWLIARNITMPLADLTGKLEEIAGGNLRVSMSTGRADEIGALSSSANTMVEKFNGIINHILESSSKVVLSLDVLRSSAKKTADGAQNQSGQAQQIATAAEEMSQTITDIAKNASAAAETSVEAMKVAGDGKNVADQAAATVTKVHDSTLQLEEVVQKLNGRVSEIDTIVTVISDIADQTNLLALNAAIEAARAGEQGRGFAVVADEVRKLAEKTMKATKEINDKIRAVQAEAAETSASMGEASEQVVSAVHAIGNVGASLSSIVTTVEKVRDQITRIATAVDEQSAAADEVTKNIDLTSTIAGDLESMSSNVMSEVNRLADTADELRNGTAGFKTKGSELVILDQAKSDHRIFVEKVAACMSGGASLTLAQLPDHHSCRFGKWYDSEGSELCSELLSFRATEAPHARIHTVAREAVAAYNAGDRAKATALYAEMERLSLKIAESLDNLKKELSGHLAEAVS